MKSRDIKRKPARDVCPRWRSRRSHSRNRKSRASLQSSAKENTTARSLLEFAMDFPDKFCTINRFMEMNFCFLNEKNKNSPFCVTLALKRSNNFQRSPRVVSPRNFGNETGAHQERNEHERKFTSPDYGTLVLVDTQNERNSTFASHCSIPTVN